MLIFFYSPMTQTCQKAQTKASNYKSLIFFMFSHSSFQLPHISVVLCMYTNLYCFHTHKLHVPIDEYTTCTRHSLNKLVVRYLHGFTMHINVYAMHIQHFPCCCWGSLCKILMLMTGIFWIVNNYRLILNYENLLVYAFHMWTHTHTCDSESSNKKLCWMNLWLCEMDFLNKFACFYDVVVKWDRELLHLKLFLLR